MTAAPFPPPTGVDALRRSLREQALAAREALAAELRAGLTARIESHLDGLLARLAPESLAYCWPYRAEPDLRAWAGRWLAADAGRRASLPVVLDKATPLTFRRWTPDCAMVPDRHGIPVPASGEELEPAVLLVPLNAFDAAGYRLGYGGGYFDRTLAARQVTAIGIGFELGRVESVFPQAHDLPMDWLVTEAGAFPCGPRA
jgi:5,10-methenyltetrahydrofolate synthetase